MTETVKRRGKIPNVPRPEPWKPAEYENEDAYAVQAVMYGRASEDQQRRACKFITEAICGVYDLEFRPGGEEGRRESDFAAGRRYVALQMIKFAKLNISELSGKKTEQGQAPKEQPG